MGYTLNKKYTNKSFHKCILLMTVYMGDVFKKIVKIQGLLADLINEFEALKSDLSGDDIPTTNDRSIDVTQQMQDIISSLKRIKE